MGFSGRFRVVFFARFCRVYFVGSVEGVVVGLGVTVCGGSSSWGFGGRGVWVWLGEVFSCWRYVWLGA